MPNPADMRLAVPLVVLFLGMPSLSPRLNAEGSDGLPARAVSVLKKNCWSCHGANGSSGLDLRSREGLLRGGERGEAIALGEPDYSLLYQSVMGSRRPYMPPRRDDHAGRLTKADLALLRQWIEAGVPWPVVQPAASPRLTRFTEEQLNFWSFRAPVEPAVPAVALRHPVDAFIQRDWRRHGIEPAPRASPRDLVRRAFFDLIGLPPAPADIAAFERDPSDEAWRQLVDRLLASPEYGVRWARHWLDLVRYADSGGFEFDNDRPNAARYRDWVVRVFNSDRPYDQFVREQLAGDEIEPESIEARIATGFLRLGPEHNLKNDLTREMELDDLVSTTSLAFLGLTTGCARCHDHKYDPISQADYYRLQSAFFSTRAADVPMAPPDVVARHDAALREVEERRLRPLVAEKRAIEGPYREAAILRKLERLPAYMREAWQTPAAARSAGQRLNVRQIEMIELTDDELAVRMKAGDLVRYRAVLAAIKEAEAARPAPLPSVMAIGEHGREPLAPFPPGGLEVMEPRVPFRLIPAPATAATTYRRRSLAEWITSPAHPLTARVMVNRIWQHHFGQGLVRTASDFGLRGERPTHPELLDWLARRFVESGWSIKQMHRVMMTSEAYRLAVAGPAASLAADPGNRLVWHHRPVRLEGEAVRDAMLAVAGTLDLASGGAAVHPFIDPALWQKSSLRVWPGRPEADRSTWRRSLYVFQKRSIRYPMFEAFDQPDPVLSCARRNSTVTAPQALVLMNGGLARGQAQEFARRIEREIGGETAAQVRRGFALALGRAPSGDEARDAVRLVRDLGLAEFCLALFNLNEFVFAP